MSTNYTTFKGSKTDLDDERINRLIARYANIHDTSKERQVGDFKSDKNDGANTRSTLGQSTSLKQADPTLGINILYKILSTDSMDKENDDGNSRICDDYFYDSTHSHDTKSSIPNKRKHRLKLASEKRVPQTRVAFQDQIKDEYQPTSFETCSEHVLKKSYAEKTTYCRPTNKIYDSNFIHKVMDKNAKLQLLLTKYVIARQKEKEKEAWRDFVNSLIEKRRCYRKLSTHFSSPFIRDEDTNPLLLKDLSTENKLAQSESCQEVLYDLHSPKNKLCPEIPPKSEESNPLNIKMISNVDSKQLHWSRVRKNCEVRNHERPLGYGPSVILSNEDILIDKTIRTKMHERINLLKSTRAANTEKSYQNDTTSNIEAESKEDKDIQTHNTFTSYPNLASYLAGEPQLRDIVSEVLVAIRNKNRLDDKVTRKKMLDRSTQCNYEFDETGQLINLTSNQKMMRKRLEREHAIFNNLFCLFMTDLKTSERLNVVNSNTFHHKTTDSDQNSHSNAKENKKVSFVGDAMTNTSVSAFEAQHNTSQDMLNSIFYKILYEELDKSNKLRSEIEAMLNHTEYRPCAVQISIDMPTKERSTEVTDSLSKTKMSDSLSQKMVIEDVSSPTNRHVPRTKQKNTDKQKYVKSQRLRAVNTDPVGLLSLLKLSTETAKQILSFVPNMTWHLPRALPAPTTTNYVCNVCGAIFARPSLLSAHILEHNLGQVRVRGCSCSVQGHAAEPPGSLFRCRYCGQLFTRSHCCELHQCACARRHDKPHGGSSLVMLK